MPYLYGNPLLFAKMEKEGETVEVRLYEAGVNWRASQRFVSDKEPQRFTAYKTTQLKAITYFFEMVGKLTMEGFTLTTKEVSDAPVPQRSGIPF